MAIYEFRCEADGLFELLLPLGTAPEVAPCPICRVAATRAISAPRVMCGTRPKWFAAMDRAEKSRHEPEVVTALPPASSTRALTPRQMTPALRSLPRP